MTTPANPTSILILATIITASLATAQPTHNHGHQPSSTAQSTTASTTANATLPTAHFRETHKEELHHLANVEKWTAQLRQQQDPDQQKATAAQILDYYRNRLIPHAQWEEAHLYPLIDKLTQTTTQNRYTDTMRHEHTIVARWIARLEAEAAKPNPDYTQFAQKADQLTGLILGHFELEDEILLPHVDKTMTREEFEKAVGQHH